MLHHSRRWPAGGAPADGQGVIPSNGGAARRWSLRIGGSVLLAAAAWVALPASASAAETDGVSLDTDADVTAVLDLAERPSKPVVQRASPRRERPESAETARDGLRPRKRDAQPVGRVSRPVRKVAKPVTAVTKPAVKAVAKPVVKAVAKPVVTAVAKPVTKAVAEAVAEPLALESPLTGQPPASGLPLPSVVDELLPPPPAAGLPVPPVLQSDRPAATSPVQRVHGSTPHETEPSGITSAGATSQLPAAAAGTHATSRSAPRHGTPGAPAGPSVPGPVPGPRGHEDPRTDGSSGAHPMPADRTGSLIQAAGLGRLSLLPMGSPAPRDRADAPPVTPD